MHSLRVTPWGIYEIKFTLIWPKYERILILLILLVDHKVPHAGDLSYSFQYRF